MDAEKADCEKRCTPFIKAGLPFQIILVFSFLYRSYVSFVVNETIEPLPIIYVVNLIGATIFAYCAFAIYHRRKQGGAVLLTKGIFRFTRHPMYTGLALMDMGHWFICSFDTYFWMSTATLYISIFIAGYLQEKETLARFGEEAKEYYAKTPRLFLFYPIKLLLR